MIHVKRILYFKDGIEGILFLDHTSLGPSGLGLRPRRPSVQKLKVGNPTENRQRSLEIAPTSGVFTIGPLATWTMPPFVAISILKI